MTALFDMDGTLFAGDSQLRFARRILRRYPLRRLYLLFVLPCAVLRALRILNTEQMKRAFLSYAWRMDAHTLQRECEEFVQSELIPAVYPELSARLKQHHERGDRTVLCSASPDWWTQPMGRALGFDVVLGTPVSPAERVPLMPRIVTPGNNKGENKVTRLRALGITHAECGYTDSRADLPMLSLCRRAVLVNPDACLRAAHPEAEVVTPPPKDFSSRFSFLLSCLLGW